MWSLKTKLGKTRANLASAWERRWGPMLQNGCKIPDIFVSIVSDLEEIGDDLILCKFAAHSSHVYHSSPWSCCFYVRQKVGPVHSAGFLIDLERNATGPLDGHNGGDVVLGVWGGVGGGAILFMYSFINRFRISSMSVS